MGLAEAEASAVLLYTLPREQQIYVLFVSKVFLLLHFHSRVPILGFNHLWCHYGPASSPISKKYLVDMPEDVAGECATLNHYHSKAQ